MWDSRSLQRRKKRRTRLGKPSLREGVGRYLVWVDLEVYPRFHLSIWLQLVWFGVIEV